MVDRFVARKLAEDLLASALPVRWAHVQGVARKAGKLTADLDADDTHLLLDAAWLHDVGYAPSIALTGFHALDGARHLRRLGVREPVVNLVAFHSCARIEARARNLEDALAVEFGESESVISDRLWYADLTTGPQGQSMSFDERLAEIRSRYGPDHLVTQVWDGAEPLARLVVERAAASFLDQRSSGPAARAGRAMRLATEGKSFAGPSSK